MTTRWARFVMSGIASLGLVTSGFVVMGATAHAQNPAFVSDDFSSGTLDSSGWTPTDPAGHGTISFPGAGTDDARLALSVPAGTNYDIWGTNRSLRVTQPVADTDFEAAAKFVSMPSQKYQTQGIVVEQDADNWLRFDVHSTGTTLRAFASKTVNGASTALLTETVSVSSDQIQLRVTRSGADWTLAYSSDDETWTTAGTVTHALEANHIGPFASNGSPYPAFTAELDWFFDTSSPVDPEDGQPATLHPLDTQTVGDGSVTRSPDHASYPIGSTVTLTAEPDEGWEFAGWSGDISETSSTATITINGPHVVTATFEEIPSDPAEPPPSETPAFMSDDFASGTLASPWEITDPGGDGHIGFPGAGTSDARLSLSVPAGHNYDIWGTNKSLRVTQPVADRDFGAEARFLSVPSKKYQTQGILVEQDADNWLRFDVHSTGSALRLFAAKTTNGTSTALLQTTIDAGSEVGLRVLRQDDTWTLEYSMNGDQWTTGGSVTHALDANHVGPFASTGSPFPAFAAELDWFFDTSAPIDPEDGDQATTYPLNTTVTGQGSITRTPNQASYVDGSTVDLTATPAEGWEFTEWTGDVAGSEPEVSITMDAPLAVGASFTEVDPPPPNTYELAVSTSGSGTVAASPTPGPYEEGTDVTLTATPASGWSFVGWSGDASGSSTTTTVTMNGNRAVTAVFEQATSPPPTIDVWYGDDQTFGTPAQSQRWVNILGNASDPEGVTDLTYQLNDAAPKVLSLGPDLRRLYGEGDFNVQIAYDALQAGENTVVITAVDNTGSTATKSVTVRKAVATPTLPHVVDWTASDSPATVSQVVDGKWTTDSDGVTIVEPGYDRNVAVGSSTWEDYEATVDVTVRGLTPGHGTPQSGAPLVGLGIHWDGHTPRRSEEPAIDWSSTGAFAWYRWQQGGRFELFRTDGSPPARRSTGWDFNTTYTMKVRAQAVADGVEYRYKWWPADGAEPAEWELTNVEDADLGHGSLLLIAHHVDATFGPVTFTEPDLE